MCKIEKRRVIEWRFYRKSTKVLLFLSGENNGHKAGSAQSYALKSKINLLNLRAKNAKVQKAQKQTL